MNKPPLLPSDTACDPSILELEGIKMRSALNSFAVPPDSGFHPLKPCHVPVSSKVENSGPSQVQTAPRKFVMFDHSLHHGARIFVFPDISESSLRAAKYALPKAVCDPPAAGLISQDAVQSSFETKQSVEPAKETNRSISQAIALLQQMRHSRLHDIFGDVLQHPVVNPIVERENCSSEGSRVSDEASEGCFQEDSDDIDALLSLDDNYSDDEDGDVGEDEDEDEDEVTSCLYPLMEHSSPDADTAQNANANYSKRKWHYGVTGIEDSNSIDLSLQHQELYQSMKGMKKQKLEASEDSPKRIADAATVLDGIIEYVKLLQKKVADLEASKHVTS